MISRILAFLLSLGLTLLSGLACTKSDTSESSVTDSSVAVDPLDSLDVAEAAADSIGWFEGTVSEAFDLGKKEGKPIYLYWGAEWCPPCHAIKATVFRSREFIERSKLFVPVYLDGDTENAQAIGEEFGVRGYPTMIVFSPDGEELTRIPGGIDIQAYANVLDLSLNDAMPATQLLDEVVNEDRSLTESECQLLTYYSWNQNVEVLDRFDERLTYRRIYDACPTPLAVERSILYLNFLTAAIEATDTEPEPSALDEDVIQEALGQLRQILNNEELSRANIFVIDFASAELVTALTDKATQQRAELVSLLTAALDRLAADENVYKRERIYTALGKIDLERLNDPEAAISEPLRLEIEELVAWADESTPDPYERQPIINAASNVLDHAGMNDVAKPLLLAELDRSSQPYYFMVSLADIEQAEGNHDEAIRWLKKAYDTSKGPATRFQWGYYYIAGLVEMTPNDVDLIHESTINVIRELEAGAGLYQRPKAQLRRLEAMLTEWGAEISSLDALAAIRNDVLSLCASVASEEASLLTCQSFLDTA